jgi:hypothetical protein
VPEIWPHNRLSLYFGEVPEIWPHNLKRPFEPLLQVGSTFGPNCTINFFLLSFLQ